MCDPVTLGLGMAASAAGGLITRNSALNAAQKQANAPNGVLSETIGGLDNIYNKTNAPAFSNAVGAVNVNNLKPAQDARVAANVGNIIPPSVNGGAPGSDAGSAPGAVGNAYKSDLADAFNFATNKATAAGKLGGYTDQRFNSNLAKQDAARKIGIGNANATSLKSLLGPEQDLAGIEAYQPPSAIGQLFSGLARRTRRLTSVGGSELRSMNT
jgi:hypothetical protein